MRRLTLAMSIAVPVVALGCHTITEELPTRPGPVIVGGATPAPVVVVPVPIPSPTAPPQGAPPPAPPRPAPNPTPNPAPTAAPAPNPPPPSNPGGQIPNNTSPATRLGAKVFFVECNGQIAGGENSTTAQVGCRIHYDVTPKDANNQHTQVRNVPVWTFSPSNIADGFSNKTGFTPTIRATGHGTLTAYAEADGIRSNTVTIRID